MIDRGIDARELRYKLVGVSRDLHKFAHGVIAPICGRHGVTAQQMHVLMELLMEPDQTVSALSDRVGILHTNFPLVCHKLESKGLIQRRRSEKDRRFSILRLTEAGEDLFREIDDDIANTYGTQFASESTETYEAIIAGLDALRSFTEKFISREVSSGQSRISPEHQLREAQPDQPIENTCRESSGTRYPRVKEHGNVR